jgi:hypothetical protein
VTAAPPRWRAESLALPEALIREARRRQRRRWLAVGAMVTLAMGAAAALIAGAGGAGGAGSAQRPPGSPAAPGPHAVPQAPAHAATLMTVSQTLLPQGTSRSLAVGYQAVWVTGVGVTYQVDEVTGRILRTIPTPGTSGSDGCRSGIAAGAHAVWVTHGCRGIYRIDPYTGRVTASLRVPGVGYGIAVAGGLVWATSWNGDIMRIQPRTGRIVGKPMWVGTDSNEITLGAGALWVGRRYVSRIALADGVPGTLGDGAVDGVSAAGAGSLWGVPWELAGRVQRVDPANGKVIASIVVPGARDVVFWKGSAWVVALRRSLTIVRIAPAADEVSGQLASVGKPLAAPSYYPEIAAGPTGLWLLDPDRDLLYHLVIKPARR